MTTKKSIKSSICRLKSQASLTIPPMKFLAVRGCGDPNKEGGDYKNAIGLLYSIAFTIKISKTGSHKLEGYFDYVVPPLLKVSGGKMASMELTIPVKRILNGYPLYGFLNS